MTNSQIRNGLLVASLVAATLLPRLIGLGSFFTVDEPLWLDRGAVFVGRLATLNWIQAIPSVQPGVTTAWLTGLVSHFDSLAASQAAIAIVSSILLAISIYLLYRLWPSKWVWTTGMLWALDPFLVAHSRIAHTDALLSLSLLASVLSILVYGLNRPTTRSVPQTRYLVYSGFLTGFALVTKIFAFALTPFLLAAIIWYNRQSGWRMQVKALFVWGAVILATVYLLWPALLVDTTGILSRTYENLQPYAESSRSGEVTEQWWYYLRESYLRVTPITVVFVPVGLVVAIFRKRTRFESTALLLFGFGLAYGLLLDRGAARSDRYILFTLLTFIPLSVVGMRAIAIWLAHEWKAQRRWVWIFSSLFAALINIFILVQLHPYYLAYHNPIFPLPVEYKLGWGEGLEQAAEWLSQNHPQAPVATFYPRAFVPFYYGQGHVDSLSHISKTEKSYIVLYRSMFERGPDAVETDFVNNYLHRQIEPVYQLKINDLPYVWIFEHLPEDS